MSMYADYINERTNDFILETDSGFATYRYLDNDKVVYIVDIYIRPEFRNSTFATCLANEITKLAKAKGCIKMLGSVVPSTKGSTISLKVLLGYGMSLESSGPDYIIFRKDI